MRVAIVSDIHGNRHAFEAVLDAIEASDCEEMWCLGDLVGYGADPDACVELARQHAAICLAGNHDMGVRGDLPLAEFSRGAALAAQWTQETITADTLDFLKRLLDTPGPSGFETAPARVWREEVKTFADQVTADVHGNSVAALNPKGTPRLMLAGHIDEIGLQITHVDDEGYVYFAGIGGWDSQVLVGQRVVISGPKGLVRGVIGKQAVHLMKREDMDKVSKITDLWIDIGAASKAETLERVRLGDAGVLDASVLEFPNDRIVSRSIDNRIGAYVVAEAMRLLAQDRPKHAAVFGVATTREEIAWTGGGARTSAVGLDPTVALVVDVTHATDWPGAEKKRAGEHKLGGGPVLARGSAVSPVVFDLLVECAEREKIPFSIQAAPHDTGTDADAIYNALRGIPTGLVSVPNRYMHSPNEMVARDDLERAARLLAAFARRLDPKISFIPS